MENIERLVIDLKESLERELGSFRAEVRDGFTDVKTEMRTGFATQATRLDRQGGILKTPARAGPPAWTPGPRKSMPRWRPGTRKSQSSANV